MSARFPVFMEFGSSSHEGTDGGMGVGYCGVHPRQGCGGLLSRSGPCQSAQFRFIIRQCPLVHILSSLYFDILIVGYLLSLRA